MCPCAKAGGTPVIATHDPPVTEIPLPRRPQDVGINVREYELMVILDPSIDERTVAPQMEKYLEQVTANGGSVEKVDIWGKRRLAYDILKRSEGIYVVINMTTTPEIALEINRLMTLNESILRTKLLRPDAH